MGLDSSDMSFIVALRAIGLYNVALAGLLCLVGGLEAEQQRKFSCSVCAIDTLVACFLVWLTQEFHHIWTLDHLAAPLIFHAQQFVLAAYVAASASKQAKKGVAGRTRSSSRAKAH